MTTKTIAALLLAAAACASHAAEIATTAAPAAAAASLPDPADPLLDLVDTLPAKPVDRPRLDPADDAMRTDLWSRLRNGFAIADLDGELVRKWEQWYAGRPDYVQRMTARGGRYLFHILEEVQRRGMPSEIALLPFTESAFNPQALSVARAAGMWQFMPLTGRDFDLKQNLFRDDRRDVLASTRAALDYLQRLHDLFGDWQLALAAYNWGQGNVQKAVLRNQKDGLPADYASLRMPDETRNYVPKLQAVKNIVLRPADFALTLPELADHPFFLSVPIERDIDVAVAARLAGLTLDEFQQLNPQMNKPVILAAGTPQVLLPYDNANAFVQRIGGHKGPLATWTAWVAPKTLKTADAARVLGISEASLREINRIPERMLVKIGSTLIVPRAEHATGDVAEHVADNAMLALAPDAPPLRRLSFRAGKRGETVAAVAKRYRATPAQVAQWNDVAAGASFRPGQAIVVMVAQAVRPAVPPARAAAGASASAPVHGADVARTGSAPIHGAAVARSGPVPVSGAAGAKVAVAPVKVAAVAARPARRAARPAPPLRVASR